MTVAVAPPLRESYDVRVMRACLRHWPLPRGRWFFLKMCQRILRDRHFLMEVEPGLFMPGDLRDWMHYWCFMGEYPGRDEQVHLSRELIRPGDTVFDVGANIGLWVMGAALRAGKSGRVHAFEPLPEIYQSLKHNLTLNELGNVRAFEIGLSDAPGTATFYRAAHNNSGMGSLGRRTGVDRETTISLTTLERHCEAEDVRRIDFMKVDVEGAELQVFRGSERLLRAEDAPVILYECSELLTEPFKVTATMIKQQLRDYGYDVYRLEDGRLEQIPIAERHDDIEDVFALKPRHFEIHPILSRLRGR
jgi:FkbM family methyltransferase